MKNLILIGGAMGVGKTAVCRALQKKLPDCVFLDGDWCWDASPFTVTDETKAMVMDNITHLLQNFLDCSAYQNVLFCWVMHRQEILDSILGGLNGEYLLKNVSLTCTPDTLRERLAKDVRQGVRKPDVLERSMAYLPCYQDLKTEKLTTDGETPEQVAQKILEQLCVCVDAYSIPAEHAMEYIAAREKCAAAAEAIYRSVYPTVLRQWAGSEDGEAVTALDAAGELVELVHLEPQEVEAMARHMQQGTLRAYLLGDKR